MSGAILEIDMPSQIDVEITLRDELAAKLIEHAERLHRRPIDLLADLIDRVLLDDLVDAVLDEEGQ